MNYIVNRKYDGLCWMCNKNRADSREHKDKQSDIKSFMNSIDDSVILKEGRKKWINGPDSPLLKYDYVLCQECNNQKSKCIDNAYDLFSKKYIRELNNKITNVNFDSIESKLNIYRFLSKNFCCRLAVNDIVISSDIIDFVNGKADYPKHLLIKVYSNFSETEFFKNYLEEKNVPSEIALFGRGSLSLYSSSNKKTEIDIVYSTLKCNNLIFEYFYINRSLDFKTYYDVLVEELRQYDKPENIAKRINEIIKNYV